MTIPDSIKVGGMDFKIELVEGLSSDTNSFGSTNEREQIIKIEKSLSEQKKWHTLLHEIMHVCWWFSGLFDRDNPKEEEIIATFSFMLYQVLKDNRLEFK